MKRAYSDTLMIDRPTFFRYIQEVNKLMYIGINTGKKKIRKKLCLKIIIRQLIRKISTFPLFTLWLPYYTLILLKPHNVGLSQAAESNAALHY